MSHQTNMIPTATLIDLVSDGVQMIDGDLEAFGDDDSELFLVISSVRGDQWDVRAREQAVLDAFRHTFDGVVELS